MFDNEITVEEMNKLKQECLSKIELADALERLYKNTDFNKVFIEEYAGNEPKRLVNLLAEPTWNQSEKKDILRSDINERMIGIARFNDYLRSVYIIAEQAEKTLDSLKNAESEFYSSEPEVYTSEGV